MLLSSHILAEVEALCDRVSIIRAGRTVETGTLAELRHLPAPRYRRQHLGRGTPDGLAGAAGRRTTCCVDGGRVRCHGRPGRPRRTLAHPRPARRASLTSQPPTLEELFLRHYRDERERRSAASRRAQP